MASSILDSDVAAIMRDGFFDVAVVYGGQTTRGHLDWEDVIEKDSSGYDVFVKKRTVTFQSSSLTGVTAGSTIVVDGVTYTVHESNSRKDDGKLSAITLVT